MGIHISLVILVGDTQKTGTAHITVTPDCSKILLHTIYIQYTHFIFNTHIEYFRCCIEYLTRLLNVFAKILNTFR